MSAEKMIIIGLLLVIGAPVIASGALGPVVAVVVVVFVISVIFKDNLKK